MLVDLKGVLFVMLAPTQLLALSGLFPVLVLSAVPQAADDHSISLPLNSSGTGQNPNLSNLSQATQLFDAGKIVCEPTRFGNPPSASCQDALDQVPHDAMTYLHNCLRSYGSRGLAIQYDVGLSKRWISCKLIRARMSYIRDMRAWLTLGDIGWEVYH